MMTSTNMASDMIVALNIEVIKTSYAKEQREVVCTPTLALY